MQVARIITGRSDARSDDGVQWIKELCAALNVPPLRTYGIKVRTLTMWSTTMR